MNGRPRRLEILRVSTLIGLLSGIGVVAIMLLRRHALGAYLLIHPDFVWMAPLASAAWFAAAGMGLAQLARWLSPPRAIAVTLTATVAAAALGILSQVPGLHWAAQLLLALGIGAQARCHLATRWERLDRAARASLLPLLLLVAASGALVLGTRARREHVALRDRPAAPAGAPNIILITLDAVRARSLSVLGYQRGTTPHLEAWARRGVSFHRAYTGASWTMPSHVSMFTGLLPSASYTTWTEPVRADVPLLAEVLAARGYATASIASNHANVPPENDLDRGFARFEHDPITPTRFLGSAPLGGAALRAIRTAIDTEAVVRRNAPEINRSVLRWIDRARREPFFVFLNYLDAHDPYIAPPPFDTMYGPIRPRQVTAFWYARVTDTAEIQRQLNAYEGAITYLDQQIGALLDSLARRGLLDRSIVVITSDHGEQVGDHGLRGHGNSLYTEVIHVPLLIIAPGRAPEGRTVAGPVSLCDLPATMLSLAGLDAALPGRTLTRWWAALPDTAAPAIVTEADYIWFAPAWTPIARGAMVSAIRGRHHYIRDGAGREELYDLDSDPREQNDLAAALPDQRDRLRRDVETAQRTGQCTVP